MNSHDDENREATSLHAMLLEPSDRGLERKRQKQCDEDPRDHLACEVQEVKGSNNREDVERNGPNGFRAYLRRCIVHR